MRLFITHTTSNYENITLNLVESIKKYSKYDIIVYTIDYDGTDKLQKEVKCIRIDLNIPSLNDDSFINNLNGNFYVDREKIRSYYALGSKVDVMLHACQFIDEWVYLDSDSIANKNVDDLFEYCTKATEFPLATLGPHEYVLIVKNGEVAGNPFWKNDGSIDHENTLEYPLMSFMGIPKDQRSPYRTTNILVGNNTLSDFISLWRDVKNLLPRICQITKITPFHEETIYNVLTWKINPRHNCLPMSYINVESSSTVNHFLSTDLKRNTLISEFYRIPKNKKEIKVFHGEKRQDEIEKIFQIIDDYGKNNSLKVLFLSPHLSTGGMPAYLLKRIESLLQYNSDIEIFVIEFCEYSTSYTVQRDRIKQIIPEERFWTINTLSNHTVENSMKVIDIIKDNSIDIVHVDEIIEGFDSFNKVPNELQNALYNNDRTWRMVETCHNIWFDPKTLKKYHPDAYALCTPYHLNETFKETPSHKEVFEFPIDNNFRTKQEQESAQKELGLSLDKTHIINVGLWTSGKNQAEGVEIARLLEKSHPNLQFHFIGNQAPNFKEYWEPVVNNLPSNVKVWGERSDVATFMKAADVFMFNSILECNPLVLREAASYGLKILARNLPQYVGMFDDLIEPLVNDLNTNVETLRKLLTSHREYKIQDGLSRKFSNKHYDFYKFLLTQEPRKNTKNKSKIQIKQFFINEPFLEITGDSDSEYDVKFFDDLGVCHYNNKIKSNHWVKLNKEYFVKWNTKILEDGVLIYDETLNYEGKRVFINFDSSSLGDTLSWIPYALEFKKVHKCDVIVSTHLNHLFRDVYPELEFVEPGSVVHNIYGQYSIGWFYNNHKEPVLPNTIPLQQTATNILGLPYTEIKPRISYMIGDRPYNEKYITIATNSTSGCKFWTKEGWQELINHLHSLGYKVINVSKEDNKFDNCEKIKNIEMDYTMNVIHHSEFLIGLSSGLSWLAWTLGKKVVMISNFTEPDHEFTSDCIRITNPLVCNGCWNNPNFKFDKSDWLWCPIHKGTKRQFECHTSITSEMVINQIKHLLK